MTELEKLNLLHPKVRQSAIDAYNEAVVATPKGVHPTVTQTFRSFEESDKIYQQGRTTKGQIISNSKAGQSYHNYSLALDFCILVDGVMNWNVDENWMKVVNIFKAHGWTWGGDFKGNFKDYPHLEKRMGYHWSKLLEMHNTKSFIPGTEFVNI